MTTSAASARPTWALKPGSRLFLGLLVPLCAIALAPSQARLLLVLDGLVLVVFALDALRLSRVRLTLTRDAPPRLPIGATARVMLSVENRSPFQLRARVRDDAPTAVHLGGTVFFDTVLGAESTTTLSYEITARRRGRYAFDGSYVRVESWLGFAALDFAFMDAEELRVTPRRVLSPGTLRTGPRNDLGEIKKRLLRAPQSGGELESLREYIAGDPLRSIDWKATARREHPVTRMYQPERSQTLWLVLDVSRTMVAAIGERDGVTLTRFDVACQTALALSQVALRAGDQVGLVLFGDACMRLVPSGRGRAQQRLIVDALSEGEAGPVPLDVRGLITMLERQARKRGFLVLLTDLDNEIHGRALAAHAPLLARRHLTLMVSLDDASVRSLGEAEVQTDASVYDKVAALSLLEERDNLRIVLEKRGVHVIEADERGIAQKTIDRYLEAKLQLRV